MKSIVSQLAVIRLTGSNKYTDITIIRIVKWLISEITLRKTLCASMQVIRVLLREGKACYWKIGLRFWKHPNKQF